MMRDYSMRINTSVVFQGGRCSLSAQCRAWGLWKTEPPSSKAQQHRTKAGCPHGTSHNTCVWAWKLKHSSVKSVCLSDIFYVAEPCVHIFIINNNNMVGIHSCNYLCIDYSITNCLIILHHIFNVCTFHQIYWQHFILISQLSSHPFKANLHCSLSPLVETLIFFL